MYTLRNEDTGEIVATYATLRQALDHVLKFPRATWHGPCILLGVGNQLRSERTMYTLRNEDTGEIVATYATPWSAIK
jgi:hypothetical protein